MCDVRIMGFVHMVIAHTILCIKVLVQLESLDLKLVTEHYQDRVHYHTRSWIEESSYEEQVKVTNNTGDSKYCQYRYPEKKQVDLMLSNMMNELTKVFVTSRELLKGNTPGHSPRAVNGDSRRSQTRFRIQDKKERGFFEHIYSNMTKEYREFYNITAERADRSGRNPCEHQEEIKYLWKHLLDRSLLTLRRAMRHCVKKYLQAEGIPLHSKKGEEVRQYFVQELPSIRENQLNVLCEKYKLCYDDLVKVSVSSDNESIKT